MTPYRSGQGQQRLTPPSPSLGESRISLSFHQDVFMHWWSISQFNFFQSRVPKHVFFCICMTSATNVLLLNHACSVWLTLLTQSCNSHCAHWNGKTADAFTCLRVQLSSCHGTWLARSFGFLRLSGHPFRVGSLYGNEHLIWLHVIYNDIYDHVVSQVNPREWGGRWQFRIISHGCWIWSDHFRVLVIVHFVLYVWFRWP